MRKGVFAMMQRAIVVTVAAMVSLSAWGEVAI